MKLVAASAASYSCCCRCSGRSTPIWVYTAVLMAALPPALNVFIMARQYDIWVAQASGSVLFGTLVSVVTLTA